MITVKENFVVKGNKYKFGKTLIIAEAGSNHNQNINYAKKMIDIAASSGCDAVKFQVFEADKIIQKKYKGWKILKSLEFYIPWLRILKKYANKKKLLFGLSVFDTNFISSLKFNDLDFIKIASTEIQDLNLIKAAAKLKKPIILSTGGANIIDISKAFYCVKKFNDNFAFLHCVSAYPAKVNQLNLNMIATMKNFLGAPIGYSDHSLSVSIPSIAVAKGACIIEKHITFDKNAKGPDHAFALNQDELKIMVKNIRDAELSFGIPIKQPAIKNERKKLARRIVANKNLNKGDKINKKNIIILRADENGILPSDIDKIIGLKINKKIKVNEVLNWDDFK